MLSQNIKESQQLHKFYNILTHIRQIDPNKNQSMQSLQFKLQLLYQLNTTLSKLSSIDIQVLTVLPNEHSENENNKPENHQHQQNVVILKKYNNWSKLKIGEILYGFITNILIYLRTQHKKTGINIYFQILFTSKYDELLSKKWKWMEAGPGYVPEQQIINLKWINNKSYTSFDKNMLFYNCLNLVLTHLSQQNTIPDFSFVIQFYKLILKTVPFVSKTLIIQLSLKILKLTVIILNNPDTKQQCIKQITQKSIKTLNLTVTSIIKQIQNDRSVSKQQIMNLNKQYEQIGNSMSLVLLRNQSIQKKLVGLKLLCCGSIGEEQFYQWIQNNEVLSTVLKENNQEVYISNSAIIFKTVLKYIKQDKKQLHKILKFAQNSTPEVRKCILKYIESTIFLQNYSIPDQILLAFVADQTWLLIEQVWSIITKFINKISNRTNQYVIDKLFYLYFQAAGLRENKYFVNKCKNIITDMFYKLLDHRNSVSFDEVWEKIIKYFKYLLTLPISLNKILLLISIAEKIIQKNGRKDFKQRLADYLISQHQIIEKVLIWVKQPQFKNIQQNIQHFLKNLVGKASQKVKITFIQKFQIILKASQNVNLFKIFLTYYKSVAQFKDKFKQFIQSCYQKDNKCFSAIKCIRHYFLTLNQKNIIQFENSQSFQTKKPASQLQGLQTIISCLYNASIAEARNQLAQLMADICTSYSEEIAQTGENNLISMFLQFIQNFDNEYQVAQQKNSYKELLGWLALAKQLMLITEIQGVGNLKPHNSLVATHYTNVKIINQLKTFISHKDNKYEKRLPCNMSLVEVMKEICNMFMCDIYEIKLLQGDHQIPVRKYGLTLEELNIHNKILRVVPGYTRKFHKKQKICADGKLTDKAQKAFTQIFYHFAKNGKLGHNQCIDFIAGVTKTQIKPNDDRVDKFINQYADMNGDIFLDNFLKFYREKAAQNKNTDIWKNLTNMGFHYDLKRNFQPRDPLPQLLMLRSYLSKSRTVYETLFTTARSQNLQLRERSIQLLFHLPSYEQNYQNLKEFLNSSEDSFQIQYLLIALQNDIQIGHDVTQNQSKRKQLINQNQIQEIFNILQRLYQKKNKSSKQQNCLLICVKILRSLSHIPDLRYKIKDTQNIIELCQFKLPPTMLFVQLLNKALVQKDIQALQWLFALQITQIHSDSTANSVLNFALLGVFDQEKEIRQITCNFIYFITLLGKDITEIYKVEAGQNCDIWYQTLTNIIEANNDNIDFQQILQICLKNMQKKRQSIQNFGDPYIYGNLSTILSIIKKYKLNLSFQKVVNIAEYVLSPASRKLIYEILSYLDLNKTIMYLKQLIINYKVQNSKELNPKSKYIGLNNLGCTCYINSVLQILFWITNFRHQLLSLNPINTDMVNGNNEGNQLLEQIQRIFFYLQNGYNRYYDMTKFCQVYIDKRNHHIDIKQQEDAHQFYNQFCQVLQGFFQKNKRKEAFQNLMVGKTMLEYVCIDCNNKLQRQQKFESLNLRVKDCSNLSESLKKYIKPQQIEDYFCENCNKKVKKITKYTTLSKLPDYMMLNLQRIQIDIQIYKKIKIASRFQFSQFLNLSQYVYNFSNQDQHLYSYKLKAVIIHAGSAESGHYYCLINIAEKWYKFDDRNVLECDVKDLEKEGFGGTQYGHHFQFDQQTFSTSAYILCYERCNLQQKVHEKQKMSFELAQFIKIEKIQIFDQLKICNDSIFQFCISLFNKYKPDGIQQAAKNNTYKPDWILDPNLQHYTQIFNLSVPLLLFLKRFWKLSNPAHISNLGTQIIYLLYLLPESTYQFLEKTTLLQCKQMLCFHPDATVRNIYKHIFAKSLHIFFFYYQYNLEHDQPVVQNIKQIMYGLKGFLEESAWHVNIYQLDSYFQFWSVCAQYIQPIFNYMLQTDIFIRFAEILQHDSSQNYAQKYQKIKQEENSKKILMTVPLAISSSICTIIQILVKYKFNQTGKSDKINNRILNQYSQKQKQILNRAQFYSNILNNEYDNNKIHLSSVIACFSKHNQLFSKQMAQIFLKGLKSYEEKTHNMWVMLQYVWHFLQVKDQFSIRRINWILGIPQLEIGDYLTFGFHKNSVNSNVFNFVSTLYFSEFNKYPPLLQKLVIQSQQGKQNKTTFYMLNFVLQICGQNQNILKLLCSLPSPNYLYCSYFQWLSIYIQKLANINGSQQLTGIPHLEASIIEMYYGLKQKINQLKIGSCTAWPYIIGRNHKLHQIYSRQLYLFRITIYEHQTYVLAKQLEGSKNLSLPNNFFSTQVSNYFISQKPVIQNQPDQFKVEQSQNLPQFKKTVISCEIKTQSPTKLTFNMDTFKQQIFIQAGHHFINLPYLPLELTDQNMMAFIEIDILDARQVTWSNRKFSYNDDKVQCQIIVEDNIYQKNCPQCTYLNDLSSLQCGICESKF